MALNGEEMSRRWKIIQEQLTCLWIYHNRSPGTMEFSAFRNDGFTSPVMTASMCTEICYFLLGIINREERDKLIKWPVLNIHGQVKFRKGVSAIVKGLIEKYPQFSLTRLPESYLIEPSHNQKKILDFLMKLANLAVILTMNEPLLFEMKIGNDMNACEIKTATTMIKRARVHEEKFIEENVFPITKYENIRMNITNKCIALKQENSNLCSKFNKIKKKLMENGLVEKEEDCSVDNLNKMLIEKQSKILKVNEELKIYSELSKEIVKNLKYCEEPITLSAEDLGLIAKGAERNFTDSAAEAYEKLLTAFDSMICNGAVHNNKEDYLKILESLKNTLIKERSVLQSFLLKYDGDNLRTINLIP